MDLQAVQQRHIMVQPMGQNTTNVPFVNPPTSKEKPKEKSSDQNLLPAVEFL